MAMTTRWAHAAGELVREFVHALFRSGNADALQELDGGVARFPGVQAAVEHQGFPYLPPYAVHGIQGRHGFLEDDADVPAADAVHVRFLGLDQGRVPGTGFPRPGFSPWAGAEGGRWTWP